jgi:hypothetical protein
MALAKDSILKVPETFVVMKLLPSAIDLSTWLSAAKWKTVGEVKAYLFFR